MKVDNPLSREFLTQYPAEAARTLEQLEHEQVAAFLSELPVPLAVQVIGFMSAQTSADCMERMSPLSAATLLTDLPSATTIRIVRLFSADKRNEILARLSNTTRNQISRYLTYPADSVGALLNPRIDVLSQMITVADAIRRIQRLDHAADSDIYIVDDQHRLVGLIDLGRLLISNHHLLLREIMSRKTQPLSIHASFQSLLSHPGWERRRRLPVVERDNTLLGVLDYSALREASDIRPSAVSGDPLENMLSLAGLYWLCLAQFMESVLGSSSRNEGLRR